MPEKEEGKLIDPLVFDTSVIFNLGHRGGLENLVKQMAKEFTLLVPPEVVEETERTPARQEYYSKFIGAHFKERVGSVPAKHEDDVVRLAGILGDGELKVIILGLDTGGTVVIDEITAREEARKLGLSLTGTLGLLAYAVSKGSLADEDALASIEAMRVAGFHTRPTGGSKSVEEYIALVSQSG